MRRLLIVTVLILACLGTQAGGPQIGCRTLVSIAQKDALTAIGQIESGEIEDAIETLYGLAEKMDRDCR
jgi:hypothetical protein